MFDAQGNRKSPKMKSVSREVMRYGYYPPQLTQTQRDSSSQIENVRKKGTSLPGPALSDQGRSYWMNQHELNPQAARHVDEPEHLVTQTNSMTPTSQMVISLPTEMKVKPIQQNPYWKRRSVVDAKYSSESERKYFGSLSSQYTEIKPSNLPSPRASKQSVAQGLMVLRNLLALSRLDPALTRLKTHAILAESQTANILPPPPKDYLSNHIAPIVKPQKLVSTRQPPVYYSVGDFRSNTPKEKSRTPKQSLHKLQLREEVTESLAFTAQLLDARKVRNLQQNLLRGKDKLSRRYALAVKILEKLFKKKKSTCVRQIRLAAYGQRSNHRNESGHLAVPTSGLNPKFSGQYSKLALKNRFGHNPDLNPRALKLKMNRRKNLLDTIITSQMAGNSQYAGTSVRSHVTSSQVSSITEPRSINARLANMKTDQTRLRQEGGILSPSLRLILAGSSEGEQKQPSSGNSTKDSSAIKVEIDIAGRLQLFHRLTRLSRVMHRLLSKRGLTQIRTAAR